ncbi:hypothetical protein L0665_09355 [Methanogenium marinum]|uniref:Uncharacterized protein n=1 Tax=Methanogenium marinum TaxID=348610 RepID=A0A9Q4KV74_9EURY|nr:hypothetical protein [Methanogenium marinum]MDE4908812.1 hypothetical protein [Methanogenium marinum]
MVKSEDKIESEIIISKNKRHAEIKAIIIETERLFCKIYGSSKNSEINNFSFLEKIQIFSNKEEIMKRVNSNDSARTKTVVIKNILFEIKDTSKYKLKKNLQNNRKTNGKKITKNERVRTKREIIFETERILGAKRLKERNLKRAEELEKEKIKLEKELSYIKLRFEKKLGFELKKRDLNGIRKEIGPKAIYSMDKKEVRNLCDRVLTLRKEYGQNKTINQLFNPKKEVKTTNITKLNNNVKINNLPNNRNSNQNTVKKRKSKPERRRLTKEEIQERKEKTVQEKYDQKQNYWGSSF